MEGTGAIMTSWFGIDALHCSNDHYVACNTQTLFLSFGSQLALVYWTVVNVLTCLSVRYLADPSHIAHCSSCMCVTR